MWWIIPVVAILTLFAVIIIRTINFKPKASVPVQENEEVFDKQKATDALAQLIRCKTVSYAKREKEDEAEFEKLISLLPKLYPNVFKVCSFEQLEDRGLLFCWKGKQQGDPAVLMAHYDVVPAYEKDWAKPAFEGIIEDGVLWGRGALDTKVTFNGVLFAADHLIEKGFVPQNDIYFAFSGGEEVYGRGAENILEWFSQKGITPALVLDEGGAVVEGVFPGVSQPCGLIGIAEKGVLNVSYTVKSTGGHASAPKPSTPITRLAKACCRINKNPFKYHLTTPVAKMFDTLGRYSSFVYRMIFANLWLFSSLLDNICKTSGGEINALMRTTVAFTQMHGSPTANVIPPKASMVTNIRLNHYDTIDSAVEYLKKTVKDKQVEISVIEGTNPSRISTTDCDGWNKVATAVASTWRGCIVSPYLMVQSSDSRHYGKITDKVYKFSAIDLTSEERATIHGHNERIRLETLYRSVEFFIRLIKQC